ncbi:hypothetical protein ACIPJG_32330 [Streptomyces halstedii]|uniref:hypothetical protein n=1 Tax=Streptomyces halstedii TaxID=1944 RepID=UPI00380B9826
MTDRDYRIETYYHSGARELAEWLVDLEDELEKVNKEHKNMELDDSYLKQIEKLKADNKILAKMWMSKELDPSRLESALRMYVAELDYGLHQEIQMTPDGTDGYPDEVDFFLRCWETAGEA